MVDYILKKSDRKTLSIKIDEKCNVLVYAPKHLSKRKIDSFVKQYEGWINENLEKQKERAASHPPLSEDEIAFLKKEAKEYIPQKVREYALIMGAQYTGVKINCAKTRYGSCSTKNSLNFSCLLMLKPLECVDYVIVHELAHTFHHNHGKEFYSVIEKYMPDYKERVRLLKEK